MTIRETIKKGMINLKTNGIEEPNLKARLLMQFILNKPRQYLLIYDNQTLSLRQEVNYFKAIKKLPRFIRAWIARKNSIAVCVTFYDF